MGASRMSHALGLIVAAAAAVAVLIGLSALAMASSRSTDKSEPGNRNISGSRTKARKTSTHTSDQRHRGRRRVKKASQTQILPMSATIDFATERNATAIDDILGALDRDLIGLVPVKRKVEEIAALLLVDQARRKFGMSTPRPTLHMCFTGPPGTGKTTMALRMAELLHRLGYIEEDKLIHAMRDDLVGQYVGHTAPKTKRILDRAMGGVLFIDEAYYLYRASDSKDYGQEAIDILLQVMEKDRGNLVVILAGYKDRMDEFFDYNPGMRSRIAHHLDFAAYELDELSAIGQLMLRDTNYYLSSDAEAAFRDRIAAQMGHPHFANARSVRNELEQARLKHAFRLASDLGRRWGKDDLMRLDAADVGAGPTGSALTGPSATIGAEPWR
jgi:probable Rubsico expression protein CbbX